MTWFWFALIPVAFWLHRKWNKKIDKEERNFYVPSSKRNEDNLGSWDATKKFLNYRDFKIEVHNKDVLVIRNSKGESFSFTHPLTDIEVEYKLDNKLIKDWKFPFWVHPNRVFETLDDDYSSELQPKALKQDIANNWSEKSVRTFTSEEINLVESTVVVSTQYGNSLQFNMKDGGKKYIPLESTSTVKTGDNIDIKKCSIVTLSKPGQSDIIRIRINMTI